MLLLCWRFFIVDRPLIELLNFGVEYVEEF